MVDQPLWKMMDFSSVGMMTFHSIPNIYDKKKKMVQTNNE